MLINFETEQSVVHIEFFDVSKELENKTAAITKIYAGCDCILMMFVFCALFIVS